MLLKLLFSFTCFLRGYQAHVVNTAANIQTFWKLQAVVYVRQSVSYVYLKYFVDVFRWIPQNSFVAVYDNWALQQFRIS